MLRLPYRVGRGFFIGHRPVTKTAICSFSSTQDSENPPKFEQGYEFARNWILRSLSNLPKLSDYQEKGIFTESLSTFGQCWLFIKLHLPKKTYIDLLEFMEGASVAIEANLRAMNNAEFPKFLISEKNSSFQVADNLKRYTTPVQYNQMALQVKKNYLKRNFYVECERMKIEKAQLAQVLYRRLTEKEYTDAVEFNKIPVGVSPEATVEQLRLYVDVATVEDLNLVFLKTKTKYVQQQNVYRVVFESRVTDPEEVDWRIDTMHIIEQKAMPRPEEAAKDDNDKKNE